ncbi:MAG: 2-phosphosulfolactate phosphatase [Planctomycetales bacterium]|nr:2-phosphosulfolactate phosphatase [Planctomycetales bacterium]
MNTSKPDSRTVRVHLLPDWVPLHELAGRTVVVVDVLRASSTLVAAISAGCERIVPCLEVPEARQLARDRQQAGADVLLGGERGGVPIAGFDLGNSPLEYTAERVRGKLLVFTTTNGTRAMMRAVGAERVLIGAFVNRAAVARQLAETDGVDVLCAGTDGQVSWEDSLFAGALLESLEDYGISAGNDAAELVRLAWRNLGEAGRTRAGLAESLRYGAGGQNVIRIGRAADIDWVAQVDLFDLVPELILSDWTIRRTGVDSDTDGRVN